MGSVKWILDLLGSRLIYFVKNVNVKSLGYTPEINIILYVKDNWKLNLKKAYCTHIKNTDCKLGTLKPKHGMSFRDILL